MSLRSAYSTIFQPVLQDGTPFQGQINAAIPGNVAIGDSTTSYTLSINSQTVTSSSGNLSISGNIIATGSLTVSAATVSNALNVSGITTVSALNVRNYLNVSGLSSLSNVNICGAVNITGNTFLNNNLEVKRSLSAESVYSTTLSGVVNINGAPYIAGGNPFNWSTLPAISDVNMAGNSISGIANLIVSSNVSISGSTTINSSLSAESVYTTTLSGVTLINGAPYIPGVNPASWSTYPAITNLSMGGFNIGNINAVSISGRLIVDGSATINGLVRLSNANVSGLLSVSGGNVQNKWNVSGQLNAESASIVANLGVSGDAVISNAYVTALYGGATTLSSLNVQSSIVTSTLFGSTVTVSDVLNVSGLATISGLTVQNTLSASELYSTTLVGVTTINGTAFNVSGYPSDWASYAAVGDVNLSGNDIYNVDNLNVSGLSVFAGGVSIPALATISAASITGSLSASNVYVSDVLNVSGLATLSGLIVQNLLSGNNISITNDLSAQDAYISNILNVSGLATLSAATIQNMLLLPNLSQSSNVSGLQVVTYNPVTSQIQQNSNITISGGNVGIGTTAPSALMHVYSNGTTTSGAATLFVTNNYSSLNSTGSDSTEAIVAIGSLYGGTPYYTSLQAKVPNNSYGDQVRLDICTPLTANNNTQQPRLSVLANSGYVGIGTTRPESTLHVFSNSSGHPTVLKLQSRVDGYNLGDDGPRLEFSTLFSGNGASYFQAAIEGVDDNSNGGGSGDGGLAFKVYSNASDLEVLRMASTGRIGIGTTTPGSKLEVLGNTRLGGSVLIYGGNNDRSVPNAIYTGGHPSPAAQKVYFGDGSGWRYIWARSSDNVDLMSLQDNFGLTVNGNLSVTGSITGSSTTRTWCYGRITQEAENGTLADASTTGRTDGSLIGWDTLLYQSTNALTVKSAANPDNASTYWTCPYNGTYKITCRLRHSGHFVLGRNKLVLTTGAPSGWWGYDQGRYTDILTCVVSLNATDTINVGTAFVSPGNYAYAGVLVIELLALS